VSEDIDEVGAELRRAVVPLSRSAAAKVTLGSMSQTVRRLEQLAYITKSRGTEDGARCSSP
jgi:hypothetical protein